MNNSLDKGRKIKCLYHKVNNTKADRAGEAGLAFHVFSE